MMMMMSRFCIVCFFLIILPAYVILGSLNTVSTMVELCNNRSIKNAKRPQATDSEVSYVGYQGWNREVVEHLTLDGMMGTLEIASHPLELDPELEPGPSRPPAPRQTSTKTYLEGPEARLE